MANVWSILLLLLLQVFSLLADFANLLAYSVVFWFDFSQVEEHGRSDNNMP